MIIYKATNKINGKVYIGQTIRSLDHRTKEYISKSRNNGRSYIHRAIHKYGFDNFKWQIICICPNIDILNEQEQYYITFYDSINKDIGYNLRSGGNNSLHSEKSKKEMSLMRLKYYKENPEKRPFGEKNSFYGKTHSEEALKKMRDRTCSEEHKRKIGLVHKDKIITEKTRKKMCIASSGKNNGMYGKHHSEETKNKIRKSRIKYETNKKINENNNE